MEAAAARERFELKPRVVTGGSIEGVSILRSCLAHTRAHVCVSRANKLFVLSLGLDFDLAHVSSFA